MAPRVVLIKSDFPPSKFDAPDPTAAEAAELIEQTADLCEQALGIPRENIRRLDRPGQDPDCVANGIDSIPSGTDIFIYWVGHGGHDEGRWFMHFPTAPAAGGKPILPAETFSSALGAFLERSPTSRVLLFLGACFSEGFLETIVRQGVVAICSARKLERQGTWAWYEFLRHTMCSPHSAFSTPRAVVERLRSLDASVTFTVPEARGEAGDAESVVLCGDTELADSMQLGEFFGQGPRVPPQLEIVRTMASFPVSGSLAKDQVILSLTKIRADQTASGSSSAASEHVALLQQLQAHGFALVDVGEDVYAGAVQPCRAAVQECMLQNGEEDKVGFYMKEVGPDNDDCGYGVNPGVFEQYKFLFSHGCIENYDYPWPSKPPDFRQRVVEFYKFAEGLCRELALAIADALGPERGGDVVSWERLMDPREVPVGYFSNGDCRFFRYFGQSEMREAGFVGEVHVDIGICAVAPLATVPGIQWFSRRDLVWRAPERQGNLQGRPIMAVWTGDVVRCLTGGHLPGGVHRVKLEPDISEDRYSMPFFIRARSGEPIQCLATTSVGTNSTAEKYDSYSHFFEERFKRSQCTSYFDYLPPF